MNVTSLVLQKSCNSTSLLNYLNRRGVYSSAIRIVSRWEVFQTGKIWEAFQRAQKEEKEEKKEKEEGGKELKKEKGGKRQWGGGK